LIDERECRVVGVLAQDQLLPPYFRGDIYRLYSFRSGSKASTRPQVESTTDSELLIASSGKQSDGRSASIC
jgi:hypothetical protein